MGEQRMPWRYGIGEKSGEPVGARPKTAKTKFRNVVEVEADEAVIKLPGRARCECQARKHVLVNNCLTCGRVVCEQEGTGPCFYCGSLVASNEQEGAGPCFYCGSLVASNEQEGAGPCFYCGSLVASNEQEEVMRAGTKRSRELRRELLGTAAVEEETSDVTTSSGNASLSAISDALFTKAAKDKDRLLSFDKDSVKRTKVIDDQSDWFASGGQTWASKEEREAAARRREALLRLKMQPRHHRPQRVTLDFMGRQVVEGDPKAEADAAVDAELRRLEEDDLALKLALEASLEDVKRLPAYLPEDGGLRNNIAAPGLDSADLRPIYRPAGKAKAAEEGEAKATTAVLAATSKSTSHSRRLQESLSLSSQGQGLCLSLHQPYASLLVRGIKKHEGRNWLPTHQGLLWIHAGGKQIPQEDIQSVEDFYRHYYGDAIPAPFPLQYPTGVIVGCVTVRDVKSRDEYKEEYPSGESESPFVLICEHPRELRIQVPMPGAPKIFRLPPQIGDVVRQMLTQGLCD